MENFRFGHRAAGDIDLLTRLGQRFGFAVEHATLVATDGTPVLLHVHPRHVWTPATSPRPPPRSAGRTGWRASWSAATSAAGRLGFPTANLLCGRFTAIPADGVYACWLVPRRGERHMAAVSIGTNPTFSGRERRVEAYVLDFDADLYGERLALEFVARLREMRTYTGIGPLVAQIELDVAQTREVLR